MLKGRPALAMVALCLVCLFALRAAARRCSQDAIARVRGLIKVAPKKVSLMSRLYTPTTKDYTQKCPSSALKCFAAEAKVLADEWNVRNPRSRVDQPLESLAASFNETESGCRQCELLGEETAEQFLRELLSTLQAMTSEYCAS